MLLLPLVFCCNTYTLMLKFEHMHSIVTARFSNWHMPQDSYTSRSCALRPRPTSNVWSATWNRPIHRTYPLGDCLFFNTNWDFLSRAVRATDTSRRRALTGFLAGGLRYAHGVGMLLDWGTTKNTKWVRISHSSYIGKLVSWIIEMNAVYRVGPSYIPLNSFDETIRRRWLVKLAFCADHCMGAQRGTSPPDRGFMLVVLIMTCHKQFQRLRVLR